MVGRRRPARPRLAGVLAIVTTALLAACSGSEGAGGPAPTPAAPVDGRLTIRAVDFRFEPPSILVEQGQEVTILLENGGRILHDFKIDGLEADVLAAESSGPLSGEEGELFIGADSGDSATLRFVPQASGVFTFYCTIDGHRQLGMEGTITVEAGP